MKVAHIWEIPDQGSMRGGDLYDTYGNLTYFADTTGLTDKTRSGVDKQISVKSHTSSRFMRDPAPFQVSATVYERSYGGGRNKGALPGYTITFVSDAGLPDEETRQFQYTGTLSALVAWLKTTANFLVDVYGPRGSLTASVPGATP
jgi:hypothetical protein